MKWGSLAKLHIKRKVWLGLWGRGGPQKIFRSERGGGLRKYFAFIKVGREKFSGLASFQPVPVSNRQCWMGKDLCSMDITKRRAIKICITHALHVCLYQKQHFSYQKVFCTFLIKNAFGYFLYLCMESVLCQDEYLQFSLVDFSCLRLNVLVCYISLSV